MCTLTYGIFYVPVSLPHGLARPSRNFAGMVVPYPPGSDPMKNPYTTPGTWCLEGPELPKVLS